MTIHCNGCAWGQVCPRRDSCANHVSREVWEAQRFPYGMPAIDNSREGWSLYACQTAEFEHYAPRDAAAAFVHGATQPGLF
jgi:hypothetical protein